MNRIVTQTTTVIPIQNQVARLVHLPQVSAWVLVIGSQGKSRGEFGFSVSLA